MTFRDDGDAARARADALERENRALREELAELKREEQGTSLPRERQSAEGDEDAEDDHLSRPRGGGFAVFFGVFFLVAGGIAGVVSTPILAVLGITLGAALVSIGLLAGCMVLAGPRTVIVLSGRPSRNASGERCGYRVLRGGRAVRIPIIERADHLSLQPRSVDFGVRRSYAKGGVALDISGVARVGISPEPLLLDRAIERFLGRSREEVRRVAEETLEGCLRGVVATRSLEELKADPYAAAEELMALSEEDLAKLGLEVEHVELGDVAEAA